MNSIKKIKLFSIIILLIFMLVGSLSFRTNELPSSVSAVTNAVYLDDGSIKMAGERNSGYAGIDVSIVGDVNGDNYDDILIGADRDSEGNGGAGQTYLVLGRDKKSWSESFVLSEANASFRYHNHYASSPFSGRQVAAAGDVNNDGYDDFLIAAENNDDFGNDRGMVYLFFGRETDKWEMDTDLNDANASFTGENDSDRLGYSLSGQGDVNADGFDDFLMGSKYNGENGVASGQTYLFLGGSTETWHINTTMTEANASFSGETTLDYSSESISIPGDINNDGFDDIIIGANDNSEAFSKAGKVYIIFGRQTEFWQLDAPLSQANASILGSTTNNGLGKFVSGMGDVNNDGFDDIGIIGSGSTAHQASVFFGNVTQDWQQGVSATTADIGFDDDIDRLVLGVIRGGDFNNDGFSDIVIGSQSNDYGGNLAGIVFMFYGKPDGWEINVPVVQANISMYTESLARFGTSVSLNGDVDNDGNLDILIGAPYATVSGPQNGAVYLNLELTSYVRGFIETTTLTETSTNFINSVETTTEISTVSVNGVEQNTEFTTKTETSHITSIHDTTTTTGQANFQYFAFVFSLIIVIVYSKFKRTID